MTIDEAADLLTAQFERDPDGLERVGGRKWWKLRGQALTGEWIEVRLVLASHVKAEQTGHKDEERQARAETKPSRKGHPLLAR